jgi:hypothetical protein
MPKSSFNEDDDALLDALGVEAEEGKSSNQSPRIARIIAGFEEIEAFYEKNKRTPQQSDDKDIFERIYAVRLEAILRSEECINALKEIDKYGLLANPSLIDTVRDIEIDDDELLDALGVEEENQNDLSQLTYVKSSKDKKTAEEIGHRSLCKDFDKFKPLFEKIKVELKNGVRKTLRFKQDGIIGQNEYFILGGQIAYIDEVGELKEDSFGKLDARLRIIFDNGAESNILLRSMQKSLQKDETGRRITEPDAGPLFSNQIEESDQESGTIYVLRSKSDHPDLKPHYEILHKIGVTGGSVSKRITNARLDPTFLMADVEVVATYDLYNIHREKLEKLIHRVFGSSRLDIEIIDRFGNPVNPQEWFLVPLSVIHEVVQRIQDGTITHYVYDEKQAKLLKK